MDMLELKLADIRISKHLNWRAYSFKINGGASHGTEAAVYIRSLSDGGFELSDNGVVFTPLVKWCQSKLVHIDTISDSFNPLIKSISEDFKINSEFIAPELKVFSDNVDNELIGKFVLIIDCLKRNISEYLRVDGGNLVGSRWGKSG